MHDDELSDYPPGEMQRSLSPVTARNGILAHYSALPSKEDSPIVATIDIRDPRNRALVHAAVMGESASLWDICANGPATIEIQDIIAHYAEYEDPEKPGELRCGPMLTLIGPNGTYHTASQYAFRALQLCAQLGDLPPWIPPMVFEVRRAQSRTKNQYQTLICKGRSVV